MAGKRCKFRCHQQVQSRDEEGAGGMEVAGLEEGFTGEVMGVVVMIIVVMSA